MTNLAPKLSYKVLELSHRLQHAHPPDLRRCPSLGQLNCRSPLTPITPVRRAASMSPQKRTGSEHTPIITGYKDEGDKENNRTLQNDEEYVKYKPGVGWLGFMVSGVFNIYRKPVIELSTTVHCDKSK